MADEKWACSHCTFENISAHLACGMCRAPGITKPALMRSTSAGKRARPSTQVTPGSQHTVRQSCWFWFWLMALTQWCLLWCSQEAAGSHDQSSSKKAKIQKPLVHDLTDDKTEQYKAPDDPLGVLKQDGHWETDGSDGKSVMCELHPDNHSEEYSMVMAQLLGTSRRNVTVVSIKRVQNNYLRVMAKTFVDTVKQMEGPSRQDLAKPRWLWHGTKTCTALDSIVHSGFNPLVSGRSTGELYGKGTYFARSAEYSHDYACKNSDGDYTLILAVVLVGRTCGHRADVDPALRPKIPGDPCQRRYDTFVDDIDNPQIFVIDNKSRTYPAYVVTYSIG